MKPLPNYHCAIIPLEKLRDYALNANHPYGKHKAKMFKAALGIDNRDAEWLSAEIMASLGLSEAQPGTRDKYGERYTVDLKIRTLEREVWIRTGWIMLHGTSCPRLTICYLLQPEAR